MSVAGQERWSSRYGVIFAVAGSAVGLGNFLRFPGQVAQYGGGAFMVAYFLSLILIGLPICWAEWTMGRYAGQRGYNSAPGVFHVLVKSRWGRYLGVIGVIIPVVIYMYYVVIEAWCLGYAVNFFAGNIHFGSAEESSDFFSRFIGVAADGGALGLGWDRVIPYLLLVFFLNFFLIYRGVAKGIELFCTYAMPVLLLLGLVILVRVLTLGTPDASVPENNVINGLGFMWNPEKVFLERQTAEGWDKVTEIIGQGARDEAATQVASDPSLRVREVGIFEQLGKPQLWLAAAGQIFFSLSVGFGVVLTYASYLSSRDDVVLSGLTATSANEFFEVGLGGLITLPAAVAFLGVSGVAGMVSTFGLGFNVLPLVFAKMPLGAVFGAAFFFLLFLAAITSSLSMLQPGIAFLEESLRIGRKQSVAILGLITAGGCGFVFYFSADLKALDTLDFWVGTFLIFVFATVQIIVFSWVFGTHRGLIEAARGAPFPVPAIFAPIMTFVTPVFLLGVFGLWIVQNVFGINFGAGAPEFSSYVKDLFITPNPVAWMSIALVVAFGVFVAILAACAGVYAKKPEGTTP